MLNVIKVADGEYAVMSDKQAIYGNLVRTFFVLSELGISVGDIEHALMSLETNDHNLANFGVNKTFIFTKKITK